MRAALFPTCISYLKLFGESALGLKRWGRGAHAAATKLMGRDPPSMVVGYHWGGAIASYMLEHRLWKGPTLLLAPGESAHVWQMSSVEMLLQPFFVEADGWLRIYLGSMSAGAMFSKHMGEPPPTLKGLGGAEYGCPERDKVPVMSEPSAVRDAASLSLSFRELLSLSL